MLEEKRVAPDFQLSNQQGEMVSLQQFRGRWVVLYFYPKDNTPGCSRQAVAYAHLFEAFQKRGVEVIGISKDSVKSHQKFQEKYALPFTLLSDPDLEAIQAYDVWQEKKLYGKISMGVVRTTYIIDPEGMIAKVMPKVKPDLNAQEVLDFLDQNAFKK